MDLTDRERSLLEGEQGRAMQLAMELIVAAATVAGVDELVEVDFAHINSCHWSGQLSEDFAEFLQAEGAELAIPTYTNTSLIDCSHPELRPAAEAPEAVDGARRLMDIYEALGCEPTWTCAPYERTAARPALGQHVIGSESNAVSFYNSVLGARTNKYGDLLDIAGALIGRVPLAGLHTDEGRRATVAIDLASLPDQVWLDEATFHVVGVLMGESVGTAVPVLSGIPAASEDQLKAIAAAGATAGSVELFHVVGVTPEARTLDEALHGRAPERSIAMATHDLDAALRRLSSVGAGPVDAVCLGTPHFSVAEFGQLVELLGDRRVDPGVTALVTTSRAVQHEIQLRGWAERLHDSGVQVVLDTCTYYTPRPAGVAGTVMTNSAKWAYYAPGILDVEVAFGSLAACVESMVAGQVVRT